MDSNLKFIDAYFQHMLDSAEIKRFEQRIAEDPGFADEVAFYVSAQQSLKAEAIREKKEWFRQLLAEQPRVVEIGSSRNVKRIWMYRMTAAAAVLLCIFFAWYFFLGNSVSPQQMAQKYIDEDLKTLSVKMTTKQDSVEDGKRLYNAGQFDAALRQFGSIAKRDTADYLIKNYLGIVYLKLGNYDQALHYFRAFENDTLFSNPSVFNQALTLLKRNLPGDKQKAKELLQRVVDQGLDHKETAQQWLGKW